MKKVKARIGNFTSSENWRLTTTGTREMTPQELVEWKQKFPKSTKKMIEDGFGKPAISYIKEKNRERKLGRSLSNDANARPLSWGQLVEKRVLNDILGMEYRTCSQETIVHPTISCWAGSPDAEKFIQTKKDAVVDVKCPMTLSSFCDFVDSFEKGGVSLFREEHADGEKYYWQLVSNAILLGVDFAELIVYCPYQRELEEIRELASSVDSADQFKYLWIYNAQDEELPHLIEGKYYKNLYIFRFEISASDKLFLTNRIIEAEKQLIEIK